MLKKNDGTTLILLYAMFVVAELEAGDDNPKYRTLTNSR
jgi:hypothetical protein